MSYCTSSPTKSSILYCYMSSSSTTGKKTSSRSDEGSICWYIPVSPISCPRAGFDIWGVESFVHCLISESTYSAIPTILRTILRFLPWVTISVARFRQAPTPTPASDNNYGIVHKRNKRPSTPSSRTLIKILG